MTDEGTEGEGGRVRGVQGGGQGEGVALHFAEQELEAATGRKER